MRKQNIYDNAPEDVTSGAFFMRKSHKSIEA